MKTKTEICHRCGGSNIDYNFLKMKPEICPECKGKGVEVWVKKED